MTRKTLKKQRSDDCPPGGLRSGYRVFWSRNWIAEVIDEDRLLALA